MKKVLFYLAVLSILVLAGCSPPEKTEPELLPTQSYTIVFQDGERLEISASGCQTNDHTVDNMKIRCWGEYGYFDVVFEGVVRSWGLTSEGN